jgi:hypothetical protein
MREISGGERQVAALIMIWCHTISSGTAASCSDCTRVLYLSTQVFAGTSPEQKGVPLRSKQCKVSFGGAGSSTKLPVLKPLVTVRVGQ